eukprot:5305710-Prorocentrum_lima.AAC.1
MGFRWVGSTWFRIERVNSQFQALSVGNIGDNTSAIIGFIVEVIGDELADGFFKSEVEDLE